MIVCDKCKKRKVVVQVKVLVDNKAIKNYDLCEVCSRRLENWLEKPATLFDWFFEEPHN